MPPFGIFNEYKENQMIYTNISQIEQPYDLILADPPWRQTKGGKKAVRENSSGNPLDYPTLSFKDIKEHLARVTDLNKNNSILFLWTIDKYLYEAEQLAKELGYKLHARMVWDKINGIPAAFTIRYGHEYLLYMYKGKFIPVDKAARGKYHSVFHELSKKHSQKPECVYEMIESLYPDLTKLEMYARSPRTGWDSFGDELIERGVI